MNLRNREPQALVLLRSRLSGAVRRLRVARPLLVAGIVTGIVACGGSDAPLRDAPSRSDGVAEAQPPLTATRIVSLVPSLAEIVVVLGAGELLVARTDYDSHPEVVDLPSVGGGLDPSLEALVEMQVDVVLMPEGQDMPALAARLGDLGVSTVGFRTETVDDLYDSIERLGALVGRQELADSLARSISAGLSEVHAVVADRPAVPVMYVIWSDPPMTTSSGSYLDELISIAGGENVFSDAPTRWPSVGYESIVRRNPSVIIWPKGVDSEVTAEFVREMPGWRDLEAVREGRVVFVDANLFNRPGPQLAEAAMALARALHPEVFAGTP